MEKDNLSLFTTLTSAPLDPTFGAAKEFRLNTNPNKINLCVGVFYTSDNKHYDMKVLQQVEEDILKDESLNKAYLPLTGDAQFCKLSQHFLWGGLQNQEQTKQLQGYQDIATVQCLSGTGALRVASDFLVRVLFRKGDDISDYPPTDNEGKILVPMQTWANHIPIFQSAGLLIDRYQYYNEDGSHSINMDKMIEKLSSVDDSGKNVVLFQVCGNNPTALDPTIEQWKVIGETVKAKNIIVLFDCTYVGYASGSIVQDTKVLRLFRDMKIPMLVAQSYSKNMTVYGYRVGALHVVTYQKQSAEVVHSHLNHIIRRMYSNPPRHGSQVAKRIMRDGKVYGVWKKELFSMYEEIVSRRKMLVQELNSLEIKRNGKVINWDFIWERQKGWFAWTEMTKDECIELEKAHSIYIQKTGRITLTHVNKGNVKYLTECMKKAIEKISS